MLTANESAELQLKQTALQTLCSLLISIAGTGPEVTKEISFLKQILGVNVSDHRLLFKLGSIEDLAAFADQPCPFKDNVDIKKEVKNLSSLLIIKRIGSDKTLEEAFNGIGVLTKRYGVELEYTEILIVYLLRHREKPLQSLVQSVLPYCEKYNIYLKNIRLSLGSQYQFQQLTLLHLAIIRHSVDDVRYFIFAPTNSKQYIPSTIWHPSGNSALQFCALCAPNEKLVEGHAPLTSSVVEPFLKIADLLTAEDLQDHLEIDVNQSILKDQCNPDGSTHLTSAVRRGCLTLVRHFIEKSSRVPGQEVWLLRHNGRTAVDIAPPHIKSYLQGLPVGLPRSVVQGPWSVGLPPTTAPLASGPKPLTQLPLQRGPESIAPVPAIPVFGKPQAPTAPSFAVSRSSAFSQRSEAKRKSPPENLQEPHGKKERSTTDSVVLQSGVPSAGSLLPNLLTPSRLLPPISFGLKPLAKPSAPSAGFVVLSRVTDAKRKSPPVTFTEPECKKSDLVTLQAAKSHGLPSLPVNENKGPGL